MRGRSLAQLLQMLKAQIGDDLSTANEDARYITLLSLNQQSLATSFDWPFLQAKAGEADVVVPAASRYLRLPLLNFDREVSVEVFYNNYWQQVCYGVGTEEYNLYNSDANPVEKMDPIQHWQEVDQADVEGTQRFPLFEVWPVPTLASTLRFSGQRELLDLENPQDVCELDDELVTLSVAIPILAKRESPNAADARVQFRDRLSLLRATSKSRDERLVLGGNKAMSRRMIRRIPIVTVHG